MKKQIIIVGITLVLLAVGLSGCVEYMSDPCFKTAIPEIHVNIKVIAHGLPVTIGGANSGVNIHIEKKPCDAPAKGKFDLTYFVDENGEYESQLIGYNIHNTKDKVYITYNCEGLGSGTITLTYDDLKNGVCIVDLNSYSSEDSDQSEGPSGITLTDLQEMYNNNKEDFLFCQDLAYAVLHGTPHDKEGENEGADKSEIYEELVNQGYEEAKKGYVAKESGEVSFIDLEDGDILMFGFDDYPNLTNAPHYAVSYGGQIWQIVHWTEGGTLDEPRDSEWFFKERTLTNPYTNQTSTSPRVYQYYRIFRR